MHLITDAEFEKNGGLTIGVGEDGKLFTLRREYWVTEERREENGITYPVRVRRAMHVRNLGKSWPEIAPQLPVILGECGFSDTSIYVPPICKAHLKRNSRAEIIPFGNYIGRTVTEVMEQDPGYLLHAAETYSPPESSFLGQWMKALRQRLAPQLKERAAFRRAGPDVKNARGAELRERLAPLAAALRSQSKVSNDFCAAMAGKFEAGDSIESLSPRALTIVREIWCRTHGVRRGSREFAGLEEDFHRRFADEPAPAPCAKRAVDDVITRLAAPRPALAPAVSAP